MLVTISLLPTMSKYSHALRKYSRGQWSLFMYLTVILQDCKGATRSLWLREFTADWKKRKTWTPNTNGFHL